jgi:hypothetical protein
MQAKPALPPQDSPNYLTELQAQHLLPGSRLPPAPRLLRCD